MSEQSSTSSYFSGKKSRDGESQLAKRQRERKEDNLNQRVSKLESDNAALIKTLDEFMRTANKRIQTLEIGRQ
jgi:TFIIF-interacting CTD phosphatase-like protein